ncbi:hypothetical protein [Methylophaga pinxianii]|jgi:hypothetical protein|nr:hypothetical protein [Methylophaga pinxianii]
MKILFIFIAAIVIITSTFAAGTADSFSDIQSKRAAQIEAQLP